MKSYPPGYGLAWSALGAGALALIVFQLVHRPGAVPQPRAGAGPSASASARGSQPVLLPSAPAVGSARATAVAATTARSTPTSVQSSSTASPSPSPTPTTPTPSPSGLVGVSAAVVVPLRGSTPAAVRVGLVIPGAPPFPLLGLDAVLAVQ